MCCCFVKRLLVVASIYQQAAVFLNSDTNVTNNRLGCRNFSGSEWMAFKVAASNITFEHVRTYVLVKQRQNEVQSIRALYDFLELHCPKCSTWARRFLNQTDSVELHGDGDSGITADTAVTPRGSGRSSR